MGGAGVAAEAPQQGLALQEVVERFAALLFGEALEHAGDVGGPALQLLWRDGFDLRLPGAGGIAVVVGVDPQPGRRLQQLIRD